MLWSSTLVMRRFCLWTAAICRLGSSRHEEQAETEEGRKDAMKRVVELTMTHAFDRLLNFLAQYVGIQGLWNKVVVLCYLESMGLRHRGPKTIAVYRLIALSADRDS